MNTKEHTQNPLIMVQKLLSEAMAKQMDQEIIAQYNAHQKKMKKKMFRPPQDPRNPHGLSYRAVPAKEDLLRDGE